MNVIIKAPLWTKILFTIGLIMMIAGVCCHFFGFPPIPDNYMAFTLIGGVVLITPYHYCAMHEILKFRPKT